jgi:hypothetical protein
VNPALFIVADFYSPVWTLERRAGKKQQAEELMRKRNRFNQLRS